jgi:hypothetical protein
LVQIERSSSVLTPVAHVHDEILCVVDETDKEYGLQELHERMGSPIKFAPDLPLTTKCFVDSSYSKG